MSDGSPICLVRMVLHRHLRRWSGGMQNRALSNRRYLARYRSYSSSTGLEREKTSKLTKLSRSFPLPRMSMSCWSVCFSPLTVRCLERSGSRRAPRPEPPARASCLPGPCSASSVSAHSPEFPGSLGNGPGRGEGKKRKKGRGEGKKRKKGMGGREEERGGSKTKGGRGKGS